MNMLYQRSLPSISGLRDGGGEAPAGNTHSPHSAVFPWCFRQYSTDCARPWRVSQGECVFPLSVVVDADSIHAQKLIPKHCRCCMIKIVNTITEELAEGQLCTSMIRSPQIRSEEHKSALQ